MMEYHVLIMPLFPWETYKLRTLEDLKKLIRIVDRLFSFSPNLVEKEQFVAVESQKSLFSRLRQYIIHNEADNIKNI